MLALRSDAYHVLEPLLRSDGEFLRAHSDEGDIWIYNCLRSATAVETPRSKMSRLPNGDIFWLEYPAFSEEEVAAFSAFRVAEMPVSPTFMSELVRSLVEASGLSGWDLVATEMV
jgi:hypothetical protein